MENNTKPGLEPIQPATPAPEEPIQSTQIPVNDSTVKPVESVAEPEVTPVAPNIIANTTSETAAAEFASEETPLQDEVLQELSDDPDEIIKTASMITNEQPKPSHTATIIAVTLALVAVALAGTFAYLYFTKPTIKLTDNTSKTINDTPTPTPTPTPSPNQNTSFSPAGTAITNSETVNELTEKVSTLIGFDVDDNLTISTGGSIFVEDIDLISNNVLTEKDKINHIVRKHSADARALTDQEVDTIENEDNTSLVLSDKTGIDGDIIADAYKNLFNKDLENPKLEKGGCSYAYNQSVDVYYLDLLGCGGSGSYYRYYHITDFTEEGTTAYVYIQAASVESNGDIFCDVSTTILETGADENVAICAAAFTDNDGPDQLFGNSSTNFARYRFVFNQADDGSYYFVKVEKA